MLCSAGGRAAPASARACLAARAWPQSVASCAAAGVARAAGARWATSKAGGSTKNGRDSAPKYLGVKLFGGEAVAPGGIIVRQRGARMGIVESTATVAFGRDWTIFALQPGFVHFWHHALRRKHFVEVVRSPPDAPALLKYPIARLRGDWELPELLRLPADTAVTDAVRARLLAYLRAVPPAQLRTLLPRGVPAIARVDEEIYGGGALAAPARAVVAAAAAAAPAAAAAAAE